MKIKIISCRVGRPPVVELTDDTLEAMYDKVNASRFDVVFLKEYPFGGRGIDLFCDDEGLLNGSPPNRLVITNEMGMVIHNDFFIVAHNEDGDTVSLTDEECEHWMEEASLWPVITIANIDMTLN